jgi:hypothetical protein
MPAASWLRIARPDARHALPEALRERDPRQARDCGWVEQMTPFVRSHAGDGGWVIDPFCGFGSTLVAAHLEGRPAAGVELDPARAALARERLALLGADATRTPVWTGSLADAGMRAALAGESRRFTLCLTNVPYFGCDGARPQGDAAAQLYAQRWYEPYLQGLRDVFAGVHAVLEPGAWCVAMAQNLRLGDAFVPLAWDLARLLGERFVLHEERVLVYDADEAATQGAGVTDRTHEYAIVCRKAGTPVDVGHGRALLAELAAQRFAFAVYGSFARHLTDAAAAAPNDIDLLCPPDDAALSRLMQWLEANGFRIESWNAAVTPPVSLAVLGYRHYFRARRVGRDGQAMQVDIAAVADHAAWERTLVDARRIDDMIVMLR